MKYSLAYLGKSGVEAGPYRSVVSFRPNLSRERVWFDGQLADPLRFREAISALHDVVVGDLRPPKKLPGRAEGRAKDRSAHRAYLAQMAEEEAELRDLVLKRELAKPVAKKALPPNLESDFRHLHELYWTKRRQWAAELMRHDPQLFRHLVPCDPIVTVAPDAVFFECFAKDEASYGCLLVDRDAFTGPQDASLGTTNVDYSLALYEHFQTLRTYRETRLKVDPEGFEVAVEGRGDYREEKIDLPPSWLRGFGQISAATALPARKLVLPVEVVYALLAHLRRHREKKGPRSIRFLLEPGKPPTLVVDPWDLRIESRGPAYDGPRAEEIKVWGRRRLFPLARVLPLAERVEVELLGTGLPSVWMAPCGGLRFVLALSGWTANDWTSGGDLALLSGTWQPDPRTVDAVESELRSVRLATARHLAEASASDEGAVRAALHRLCERGQAIYDFAAGAYRYRQVIDGGLDDAALGPEPPELTKGRALFVEKEVTIRRDERLGDGRRLVMAKVGTNECESIFDGDGVMTRARCGCSHFYQNQLKKGPCRHLIALRLTASVGQTMERPASWVGKLFSN